MKNISDQAEALFNICQFEYSLLGYQKGLRLVPDSEEFNLGIIKCKKTITGTLAPDAFDFSGQIGESLKQFIGGIKNTEELLCEENIAEKVMKPKKKSGCDKMKGSRMKADYEFLKMLSGSITNIPFDDTNGTISKTDEMNETVQEAIEFLDDRAEFWTNVK